MDGRNTHNRDRQGEDQGHNLVLNFKLTYQILFMVYHICFLRMAYTSFMGNENRSGYFNDKIALARRGMTLNDTNCPCCTTHENLMLQGATYCSMDLVKRKLVVAIFFATMWSLWLNIFNRKGLASKQDCGRHKGNGFSLACE